MDHLLKCGLNERLEAFRYRLVMIIVNTYNEMS